MLLWAGVEEETGERESCAWAHLRAASCTLSFIKFGDVSFLFVVLSQEMNAAEDEDDKDGKKRKKLAREDEPHN